MAPWQIALGLLLALALGFQLFRRAATQTAVIRNYPSRLFAEAAPLLAQAEIGHGDTVGSYTLNGYYEGHPVRVKAVTDTLATRKLPSLWLMVTIPEPVPVRAVFDLMMRPAGIATFSNFDQLPYTLPHPTGFPDDAVIHTDDPAHCLPPTILAGHLKPFFGPRSKELLITAKGLRLVSLLAEGDRLRYGVFRQASFGDVVLAAEHLRSSVLLLLALQADIENWHKQTQ